MERRIIHSQEMWLRMTQLEYNSLSNEEFKSEIERIYIEEYGRKVPAYIHIYSISDSEQLKNNHAGYKGTAVYFQSKKNGINEVYVISQGTQNAQDWKYNLQALLAGTNIDQAKEADRFVNEAKHYFATEEATSFTGLSHSLAHNNNATAHLLYGTFDDIYSVNGAQTNAYQLFNNGKAFADAASYAFSLNGKDDIYQVNPDELAIFAKAYYSEKGSNIHQIISEDDPLYAMSGMRGFFTLGEVKMYETNPDYPGLRNIMDSIPDDIVQDIQELAIQYTDVTENGGSNDGIQSLTGIHLNLINKLDRNPIKAYITQQKEIDQMARSMRKKLPHVLSPFNNLMSHADSFLQRFVDADYINPNQKELIVSELSKIQGQLKRMQHVVSFWSRIRAYTTRNPLIQLIIDVVLYMWLILLNMPAFKKSLTGLNKDDLCDTLTMIRKGHNIESVLNVIAKENKTYQGNDMMMTGTGKARNIQINVSDALRLYRKGKKLQKNKHFNQSIKKAAPFIELHRYSIENVLDNRANISAIFDSIRETIE